MSEAPCKHTDIDTFFFHDGTPAQFWGCTNCMVKFVPITELLQAQTDLVEANAANVSMRALLHRAYPWLEDAQAGADSEQSLQSIKTLIADIVSELDAKP